MINIIISYYYDNIIDIRNHIRLILKKFEINVKNLTDYDIIDMVNFSQRGHHSQ